jgi:hypothetical protein
MPRRQPENDPVILQAALDGLELQRTRIEDQITSVRSMLHGSGNALKANGRRRKYRISAEGRARIVAASRRRWAAIKKAARKKAA